MSHSDTQAARMAATDSRLKTWRVPSPFQASKTTPPDRLDGSPSLWHVIAHAVDDARNRGLDECQQYNRAVRAIMRVEPDRTLLATARLVNAYLEQHDKHSTLTRFTAVIARTGIADPAERQP